MSSSPISDPQSPISDSQLIKACQAGDETAWQTLITRYKRLVYTIPMRFGFTTAEADDVFQTVWTTLVQKLPTLTRPDRIRAWLVTTARRECLYRLRQQNPPDLPPPDQWVADLTPEEIITRYEPYQQLHTALDRLSARCRRLLHLLYIDPAKPTYANIAQQLQMRVGAIGPTRGRCLEQLRQLMTH